MKSHKVFFLLPLLFIFGGRQACTAQVTRLDYEENPISALIERNNDFLNNITTLDHKILHKEFISIDDARSSIPTTAEEVAVMWEDYNEGNKARGYRVDSVCFAYTVARSSMAMIDKYLLAAFYSEGYAAELYYTDCYVLWKKFPEKVEEALSLLFEKYDIDNFHDKFLEWKDKENDINKEED